MYVCNIATHPISRSPIISEMDNVHTRHENMETRVIWPYLHLEPRVVSPDDSGAKRRSLISGRWPYLETDAATNQAFQVQQNPLFAREGHGLFTILISNIER